MRILPALAAAVMRSRRRQARQRTCSRRFWAGESLESRLLLDAAVGALAADVLIIAPVGLNQQPAVSGHVLDSEGLHGPRQASQSPAGASSPLEPPRGTGDIPHQPLLPAARVAIAFSGHTAVSSLSTSAALRIVVELEPRGAREPLTPGDDPDEGDSQGNRVAVAGRVSHDSREGSQSQIAVAITSGEAAEPAPPPADATEPQSPAQTTPVIPLFESPSRSDVTPDGSDRDGAQPPPILFGEAAGLNPGVDALDAAFRDSVFSDGAAAEALELEDLRADAGRQLALLRGSPESIASLASDLAGDEAEGETAVAPVPTADGDSVPTETNEIVRPSEVTVTTPQDRRPEEQNERPWWIVGVVGALAALGLAVRRFLRRRRQSVSTEDRSQDHSTA